MTLSFYFPCHSDMAHNMRRMGTTRIYNPRTHTESSKNFPDTALKHASHLPCQPSVTLPAAKSAPCSSSPRQGIL